MSKDEFIALFEKLSPENRKKFISYAEKLREESERERCLSAEQLRGLSDENIAELTEIIKERLGIQRERNTRTAAEPEECRA